MEGNFKKLFDSIKFRFMSVFSFKNMSAFAMFCKTLLILVLGMPFCIIEFFGVICALCTCLPAVGVIFNFTLCLIFDLLASGLFYLIMLPNLNSLSRKNLANHASFAKTEEMTEAIEILTELLKSA